MAKRRRGRGGKTTKALVRIGPYDTGTSLITVTVWKHGGRGHYTTYTAGWSRQPKEVDPLPTADDRLQPHELPVLIVALGQAYEIILTLPTPRH